VYCRACNSIVPEKRFCPCCGARLPRAVPAASGGEPAGPAECAPGFPPCAVCREPVAAGYAFCPNCGERVTSAAGSGPVPEPGQAAPRLERRPVSDEDKARIEATLLQAARQKARKQYPGALLSARSALAIDPDCADTHAMIGDIHHAAGSLEDAIVEYTNAVDLDPERPGFRERLKRLEEEHARRGQELSNVIYEHEGDIASIFGVVFTRDHPKWYKRGWFNAVLFVVFFALTLYLAGLCRIALWYGPIWLQTILFAAAVVSSVWIFIDAQASDKPGLLWAALNLLSWFLGFSFLGIIIYVIFRL
jgi:tetratricopeptide (TPR) repeat protein